MSSNNGSGDSRALYAQAAEQKLEKDELLRAFDALDNQDQEIILDQCEKIERKIKSLRSRSMVGFGELSSMELVARIGIWMIKNNLNPEDIANR